jgi:hypothetical protein
VSLFVLAKAVCHKKQYLIVAKNVTDSISWGELNVLCVMPKPLRLTRTAHTALWIATRLHSTLRLPLRLNMHCRATALVHVQYGMLLAGLGWLSTCRQPLQAASSWQAARFKRLCPTFQRCRHCHHSMLHPAARRRAHDMLVASVTYSGCIDALLVCELALLAGQGYDIMLQRAALVELPLCCYSVLCMPAGTNATYAHLVNTDLHNDAA